MTKNDRNGIRHRDCRKNSLVLFLSYLLCGSVLATEGESSTSDDLFKYKVLNDEDATKFQSRKEYGEVPFTVYFSNKEHLVLSSYVVTKDDIPDDILKEVETHITTIGLSLSKQTDTKMVQFISELDLDDERLGLHQLFERELAYTNTNFEATVGGSALVTFIYLNQKPMTASIYEFAPDDYVRGVFGKEYFRTLTTESFSSVGLEYDRINDWDTAFKYFWWSANNTGDRESQFNAGVMRMKSERYEEAILWFEKSSDQNYVQASTVLGYSYSEGLGVERDREKAIHYYKKAVEEGSGMAANNLGVIAAADEEFSEALGWFQKSKELGYENADAGINSVEIQAIQETREFLAEYCDKYPGECS